VRIASGEEQLRPRNDGTQVMINYTRKTIFLAEEIMSEREAYAIEIAGIKRELPLFEIKPGLRIAILNILGDTELVQASARELGKKLKQFEYDVLITAEAKSIPLAYAVSVEIKKPYVVLRKTYKPYMGDALKAETLSITTGQPQTLILDEKDRQLIQGKKVVILDDVISTGSTLQGMRVILEKSNTTAVAEAAILTEGDREEWKHIISLGHLPLFTE
jgi:adenine phosphoribosyltransferase